MTQFLKGWTATTTMLDRNSFDQLPAASRRALALVCKGCQPVADYERAWAAKAAPTNPVAHGCHFAGRSMLGTTAAARVKQTGRSLLKQAVKQHASYVVGWPCVVGWCRCAAQVESNGRPARGALCRPAEPPGGQQRQQPLHGM